MSEGHGEKQRQTYIVERKKGIYTDYANCIIVGLRSSIKLTAISSKAESYRIGESGAKSNKSISLIETNEWILGLLR